MSDFETVREAVSLKSFCEDHLEPRGKTYVCPNCGSGSHEHKTPAFSLRGERWKCFACDQGGDVFDLQGILSNTGEKREQLEAVASWAGIPLTATECKESAKRNHLSKPKEAQPESSALSDARKAERAYVLESQGHLSEVLEYVTGRGFTEAEARSFGFGYDPNRQRLIIPWKGSTFYHSDRDTTEKDARKYLKPSSSRVGTQPLYNPKALETAEAVFIVEGALDALAVIALGFEAIATGGGGYSSVASQIASHGYKGVLIAFMDNDESGRELNERLAEALESQGLTVYRPNLEEMGEKDACDLLKANRDGLRAFLSRVHEQALQSAQESKERAYSKALAALRVKDPIDIATEIYGFENEPSYTPTGIGSLDSALNGGLSSGLTVLGALSSLGKTTLCVQIADAIAAQGRPVLFASIEQSGREIVAKSLSRIMAENEGYTTSTVELQSSRLRNAWPQEKAEAFMRACTRYSHEVAPHLSILEAVKRPTVADIRTAAQLMAERDGIEPLIFVDYLQLLAPESDRLSTRESVEANVTALRQMAIHELKAPIVTISSINRGSYANGVTLDAFKESGNIEFSSDVCLGLQPRGMNELEGKSSDAQTKREADKFIRREKGKLERPCELFILKNRNAPTPEGGIPLTFKTIESRFVEE